MDCAITAHALPSAACPLQALYGGVVRQHRPSVCACLHKLVPHLLGGVAGGEPLLCYRLICQLQLDIILQPVIADIEVVKFEVTSLIDDYRALKT